MCAIRLLCVQRTRLTAHSDALFRQITPIGPEPGGIESECLIKGDCVDCRMQIVNPVRWHVPGCRRRDGRGDPDVSALRDHRSLRQELEDVGDVPGRAVEGREAAP